MLVLIHHTLESQSEAYGAWSHQFLDLGRVGIVAFFLVSGYVVGLTLSKQTPRVFAVRRFWRLYPIYWIATTLWIVVWIATGHTIEWDLGLIVIVSNIAMIQGFIGMFSILGVAWTLGIEIAFYAQQVASRLLRFFARSSWLGFGWLAAFGALGLSNWLRGSAYSAVVPLMMFTASLGFAWYRWDAARDRSVFVLAGSGLVLVPLFSIALGTRAGEPGVWPASGFITSYFVGIALFAAFAAIRSLPLPRWLLWLGAVSYSLYLTHTTVIELVGTTPLWRSGWMVATVSVAVCALVVAGLLHRYVERPFTNLGRRLTTTKVVASTPSQGATPSR